MQGVCVTTNFNVVPLEYYRGSPGTLAPCPLDPPMLLFLTKNYDSVQLHYYIQLTFSSYCSSLPRGCW